MEAFGLSDINYILSLWRANEVTVEDWNHHPQMYPLEGNSSGDQTRRVVWLADSHGDVLVPSPYPMVRYGLSNGPSTLLDCHWVCSEVG